MSELNIGLRIRELRIRAKEKHRELGEAVGLTQFQIGSYETGVANPRIESIVEIAKHYNVTTDYLFGLSDDDGSRYADLPDGDSIKRAYEDAEPATKMAVATILSDSDTMTLTEEQVDLLNRYQLVSGKAKALIQMILADEGQEA